MTHRENVLRAVRFEQPEYIPMVFHINAACWHHYDQHALQDLMEQHRFLFPHFMRQDCVTPVFGANERQSSPYTDPWGCVWETTDDGIVGSVRHHPLAEWHDISTYRPPDPALTDGMFPIDWQAAIAEATKRKEQADLVYCELPHGHTFLRLADIRGYENLLVDMSDGDFRLTSLIDMVQLFNEQVVLRRLDLGPDIMGYPDDLGMQQGPMIAPRHFRQYIKPLYQRLMRPARDRGCVVHMHSDGDIRLLAEDLLDCGVDIINLQDRVNGIGWIAEHLAGRICIDLDIDRQHVTVRGTPKEIDDLILEEVRSLGGRQGGLMMIYGLYPGVPLRNVRALMDAMEKYSTFHS